MLFKAGGVDQGGQTAQEKDQSKGFGSGKPFLSALPGVDQHGQRQTAEGRTQEDWTEQKAGVKIRPQAEKHDAPDDASSRWRFAGFNQPPVEQQAREDRE